MRHYLPRLTTARIVGTRYYGAVVARRRTVEVTGDMEAQIMAMPRTDLAAAAQAEFAELERLWYELEPPDGVRIELIEGELVVSPTSSIRNSAVVFSLTVALVDVAERENWVIHTFLTSHIPQTRERLIPDLMVAPRDAPPFGDCELLSPGALLVAEVVSPSSRRRDRDVKRRAYAQGRVPLYLLVDRFATPPSVTLFSEPGQDGYEREQTAEAGQPLRLPEPFGIDLDTGRLLD
jgi:Uma2 family endonuclease